MTALPGQSMILSGGYSPWQAPLAALFSGISAAGQPGGWSNFGQGVGQGVQNFQAGQQNQQMMQLRQMQIQQAEEDQRRANQEDAQRKATIERLRQLGSSAGSSTVPVNPVGNYGAATGGIQTASGSSPLAAMFQQSPQLAEIYGGYLDTGDVGGALDFLANNMPQSAEPYQPESSLGKLKADLDAGLIDRATYDALVRKETYIAPQQGPQQPERVRLALEAGLQPGTPEYKQFLLGRDDTPPGLLQGTGLDQQMYNIVLSGTKNGDTGTPEYAAAYAQLAMPKVTFDPVTQKTVIVQPDMSWAKPPTGRALPTTSQAPNATQTQVPGATITSDPGKPVYNEGQGKAATFSDRMIQAESSFDKFATAGMDRSQSVLSSVPFIGNSLVSKERQQFDQAERNFINAQLRRESGAVISAEEFADARKQYIPQPGDDEATLAQKKENRRIAREGMARESGPFYQPDGGNTDYQSMYGLTPTQ